MPKAQLKMEDQDTSKRLRVMHVMFTLEPGGLENGVVNIANKLNSKRFETSLICLERVGSFADRLKDDVDVECLRKNPGFSPLTVCKLARLIRKLRPDVIHTHNLGPLTYAILARITSFSRVPILHGEHGTLHGDDLRKKRLLQRKVLYRFCSRIHTVSASLKKHLIELGLPASRISSVVNGVDCERFHPPVDRKSAKTELGLDSNSTIIGIVGRLVPGKRHQLLLDAFKKFSGSSGCENAQLLLLGDTGEERESILAAIRTHPARDRIIWGGHQKDPAPWYKAMDLLAMPSSEEGLSNALLEAMASGVPCVAHPACGANEVIVNDSNGVLRAVESADELADVLCDLVVNPEKLSNLGREARKTIVAEFSLNRMVEDYATLYESVVSG